MHTMQYGESPESIVAHACHHMEEPSEPEGGSASALSSDHDHLHAQLSSAGLGSSSRRGSMMSSGSARQRQQRQSVAKVNPRAGLLHRVHLRAGHEVLTERPGFIVGLFTGLVQKACEELRNGPLTEPSTPAESEGPTPEPTPREVKACGHDLTARCNMLTLICDCRCLLVCLHCTFLLLYYRISFCYKQ
jgi:hypothetical protein